LKYTRIALNDIPLWDGFELPLLNNYFRNCVYLLAIIVGEGRGCVGMMEAETKLICVPGILSCLIKKINCMNLFLDFDAALLGSPHLIESKLYTKANHS